MSSAPPPSTPSAEPLAARFAAERGRLFALAYRMLGTAADAEDVLQDAWLRLSRAAPTTWEPPLLTTIVLRLCLDHLKSARVRREAYPGTWLPEPIVTDAATFDRDSLALALLVVLETLAPAERAAYLLHEVFDWPHDAIARALGKRPGATRQLLLRARARVGARRPRFAASPADVDALLGAFLAACASGDVTTLRALLTEDVRALSDGGGKVAAARRPVLGADDVARFLVGLARRLDPGIRLVRLEANGAPALLFAGDPSTLLVFDVAPSGRIAELAFVRNPAKLARLLAARG